MTIYDKANWHIDYGENEKEVLAKYSLWMEYLHERNMLSHEGEELFELGVDDSFSLTDVMVTKEGNTFLEREYNLHAGDTLVSLQDFLNQTTSQKK